MRGPDAVDSRRITLDGEAGLAGAAGWLYRMLAFDHHEYRWVLMVPTIGHRILIVADANDHLHGPDQVALAQQWAAGLIDRRDADVFAVGFTDSVTVLRVTEWRPVDVDGQCGWVPLFNITRACQLGVDDLARAPARTAPVLKRPPPRRRAAHLLQNAGATTTAPIMPAAASPERLAAGPRGRGQAPPDLAAPAPTLLTSTPRNGVVVNDPVEAPPDQPDTRQPAGQGVVLRLKTIFARVATALLEPTPAPRPAADAIAPARCVYAVRRDWADGAHEFIGPEHSLYAAVALWDREHIRWRNSPWRPHLSVVVISDHDFWLHAAHRPNCRASDCPTATGEPA